MEPRWIVPQLLDLLDLEDQADGSRWDDLRGPVDAGEAKTFAPGRERAVLVTKECSDPDAETERKGQGGRGALL